jgi:hypothetical protein
MGFGVAVPFRSNIWWITAAGGSGLGGNLPPTASSRWAGRQFPGLRAQRNARGRLLEHRHQLSVEREGRAAAQESRAVCRRARGRRAVYDRFDQEDAPGIYGGSFFLTGRTMVGPLTVGVGATSTDSWSVWLSIGRPVGHGTILERGIFR